MSWYLLKKPLWRQMNRFLIQRTCCFGKNTDHQTSIAHLKNRINILTKFAVFTVWGCFQQTWPSRSHIKLIDPRLNGDYPIDSARKVHESIFSPNILHVCLVFTKTVSGDENWDVFCKDRLPYFWVVWFIFLGILVGCCVNGSACKSLYTWKSPVEAKHEVHCGGIDDPVINNWGMGHWFLLWKPRSRSPNVRQVTLICCACT